MNSCPVCRSILSKTHNSKLLCKICGYVAKNLEVATDNQQYQQRHNYTQKINQSRSDRNQENKAHCNKNYEQEENMKNFQTCLKKAIDNFIQHHSLSMDGKKLIQQARKIWFYYLSKVQELGLQSDVMGIFDKIKKKTKKNEEKKIESQLLNKEDKGKEDNLSDNNQALENQIVIQEYKQMINEAENDFDDYKLRIGQQYYNSQAKSLISRKRRTKKKVQNQKKFTFQQQIKNKLSGIKKKQISFQQKIIKFLEYLFTSAHSPNLQQLQYVSKKYALMLIFQKNKNNEQSKNFSNPCKLTKKALKKLSHLRNHLFSDYRQIILVLLLEDLLKIWHMNFFKDIQAGNIFNYNLRLEQLIITYQKHKYQSEIQQKSHQKSVPIISKLLEQLIILINVQKIQKNKKQIEMFNLEKSSHNEKKKIINLKIPKLSFTLIYSIIYLATLACNQTYTINQIVLSSGILQLQATNYNKININNSPTRQLVRNLQKFTSSKIKKYSFLLYKFLKMKDISTLASIKKWVNKYVKFCKIEQNMAEIQQATQVIYKNYQITKQTKKLSKIDYLEQDSISKAIIIIYFKLHLGLDHLPYLVTLPQKILENIKSQQQQFLSQFINMRKNTINLLKVLYNLHQKNAQKLKSMKQVYPIISQKSLQNLQCNKLIEFTKNDRNDKRSDIVLPQPSFYLFNNTQHIPKMLNIISQEYNSHQQQLNPAILTQVNLVKSHLSENNNAVLTQFNDYLDWPADNYQFFYHYTYNIRHSGRQILVYFIEQLIAGETKEYQFYYWLQKLEGVLIEFQD